MNMKIMNKQLFFAAVASIALFSCTNDDITGGNPGTEQATTDAIAFGSGFKALTRSTEGAAAAALLNNRFIVGGFKTANGTDYNKVFDNYAVKWVENTAGKTESNTSDWEYVGVTPLSPVTSITSSVGQTVKFWDYSSQSYDFIAYSTGTATEVKTDAEISASKVMVEAIDHTNKGTKAYTLKGAANDLAGCYIADLVTVNKADYKKEVNIAFHSLSSKVRIALYETIPGYKVKNVQFYNAAPTTLGTGTSTTATLIGSFPNTGTGTYTVSFDNNGKAQISPSGFSAGASASYGTFPSNEIGTTSAAPTFAGTSPYYQTVLPVATGNSLQLAVDYTLESEDGSGEVIKVYGATAHIPATYTKWQPNFAYTYIFKISNNTNGWTSTVTTDPSGLFPITFDAVVLDSEEAGKQATITTVATPSITTYQKGHDTTKNEYAASNGKIYIQVMIGNTLQADLDTKGKLYTASTTSTLITEASVMDALNLVESGTTGRNGITLTDVGTTASLNSTITAIPGEDGNDITVDTKTAAEFTPSAGTYAYVYDTGTYSPVKLTTTPSDFTTAYYSDAACTTPCTGTVPSGGGTYYQKESYIYTAEKYTSQPADFTTAGIYYEDPNGTKDVTTSPAATFSSETYYYKKYTVNHKVYGVKVIKVVS
jgi:hypothetical protein